MIAVRLTDIHKGFKGKQRTEVKALQGLSLSIELGEVFGFLGPNGAGKTTTIKILMGLIKPSSGKAEIMGRDVSSPQTRLHVGYLPENPSFYDYMTAKEYLQFTARIFRMEKSAIAVEVEEKLKLLELWDARSRPIRSYSKGMVQRLGLAQTLIHNPDVYILDEPMSGLDPLGRALVKQVILDLKKKGKCVFFSTHITADVEAICDRVGILRQGRFCNIDRVEAVLTEGIIGYHVKLRGKTRELEDRHINKEALPVLLSEATKAGLEIVYLEPKRKDLEAFFLDSVKDSAC